MILTIRPATAPDVEWISTHLRDEDVREVETASGKPVEQVLPVSVSLSRECYTIRLTAPSGHIEQYPSAIFGIANDTEREGMGVMWLLATPGARRAALSIMREAPKWLDHFNQMYPNGIHNMVDSRNDLHVRWLLLSGFTFGHTFDIRGVPFVHALRFTESSS